MRGKVKYVTQSVWYEECSNNHWSSEYHSIRHTNTYAVLYNGNEVDIDEDEIRDCYDCQHINRNIINELSNDLHNVWIEYSEDDDGDYSLDDDLEDLV